MVKRPTYQKSIYLWEDPAIGSHRRAESVIANQSVDQGDEGKKATTADMGEATPGTKNGLPNNYYTLLASLESTNDPNAVNRFGYIGKYQMGVGALVDTGYLKEEAYSKGNKAINEASMWTGKNDIRSKDDFLANEKEQEAAVRAYTYLNRAHLTNNKIGDVTVIEAAEALGINTDSLLASSHLLGAEGMKNYVNDLYELKNATASDDYDVSAVQEIYERLSGYKDGNGKTAADRIKEFGGSIDIDFDKIQSTISSGASVAPREPLEKLPSIGEPINDIAAVKDSALSRSTASALIQSNTKTMGNDIKENPGAIDKASKIAQATNIANIGASIAGGLYSMWQVNKMKTPEAVVPEKVEAVRIGDRGAALAASGQSSIDRGIATSRNALQRAGRADMLPTLTAAESGATNQLAGSVEQMRLQIDQMNAAAEARAREINASAKSQTSLFNNQTLQAFQQMKSQLGTQAISTMGQNISANASAISSNAFGKAMYNDQKATQERMYTDQKAMYEEQKTTQKAMYDDQKAMYEDQVRRQEEAPYIAMASSSDPIIKAQGVTALKKLRESRETKQ